MRSACFRSILLTALLLAASVAHFGQSNGAGPSGQMFAGEILKYDGKLSKLLLRGMSVAELTFSGSSVAGSNEIIIRGEAVSKGTLLKLFRFSFLQQYGSTVDLTRFRILKTTKHDVQKQRVRDSEAVFDYAEKRVTYIETDPKDINRPPRRIASEIGEQIYDMVTAIYAVRLLPLATGTRLEFLVSDSGLVFKVPFAVTGREQQKTIFGKIWCLRVEPQIFGPGRLIELKGKMVIWMTEDERHTPVRAQVDSPYGKIDIKLKSAINPGNSS